MTKHKCWTAEFAKEVSERGAQGQLQAWDRDHGWHNVLEATEEQVYGKCVKCGKPMTELEASESEMGAEFKDDLICDECFEEVTLEIAKGAFPNVFS